MASIFRAGSTITSPRSCARIRRASPGLGTIPLQDPELAARELERCVRELGSARRADRQPRRRQSALAGRTNCRNLDDRSLDPVWSAAEELGRGDFRSSLGHGRQGAHAEILAALARRHAGRNFARDLLDDFRRRLRAISQDLRVAFAHGGGAFPFTIGRIEHGFNVRPDLVAIDSKINPRSYLARLDERGATAPARFYVDSLVHDPDALRLLLKLFGAERIALGSDYPFPLGEAHPGELIESMPDFSPEEKTRLLSGSAREFLALH